MARTALLKAIQRLAEEHRSADRLGIAPAELRERRAEGALSRREFLKRAGVAGAVVAAGPLGVARLLQAECHHAAFHGELPGVEKRDLANRIHPL